MAILMVDWLVRQKADELEGLLVHKSVDVTVVKLVLWLVVKMACRMVASTAALMVVM